MLKSKAFFMSSVSKEDQYKQNNGIKEKLMVPSVGRYKPKYEMVFKKPMAFVYREEHKKRFHRKSHSMK